MPRKSKKDTPLTSQSTQEFSEDEGYLKSKYPSDNIYQEAVKNFTISTQDKKSAGSSKTIKELNSSNSSPLDNSSFKFPQINYKNDERSFLEKFSLQKDSFKILTELKESVSFMSEKFDQLINENRQIKEALRELNIVKCENMELKSKISELEKRLSDMEISEVACNLEIHGTEVEEGTDAKKILLEISNDFFESNVCENDILNCSVKSTKNGPIIIAKFVNPSIKAKVLKNRKKRSIFSNELSIHAHNDKIKKKQIFINEQLTTFNKNIFINAYKKKKECGYKFCWTRNGKIFLRKTEDSPIVNVNSLEILTSIN